MAEVRGELVETTSAFSGLQNAGRVLTLGLAVPLLAVGAIGVKSFADIDESLRNVNSIAHYTEQQFQDLTTKIISYGGTVKTGALGASNALYTIVSAGFGLNDVDAAFKLMTVSVKTAEAGMADAEITTQALVSALLAYGQGADQAQHFSDVLTRTVAIGVGTMEQFAGSIGMVLPTATALGVTFEDLGATSAFLTQRGLSPSEAFTSLNSLFRQLIKPGDDLAAVFSQLGVASGTELIRKFGGIEGALRAITGVAGTSAETINKLFTEIRASRGALSIVSNFDAFTASIKDFGSAVDGATMGAWAEQTKSLAWAFEFLKSKFMSVVAVIGRQLAPAIRNFLVGDNGEGGLGGILSNLISINPELLQTIIKFAAMGIIIPPLIWAFSILLGLISPLTIAITGLMLAFTTNFGGFGDTVRKVVDTVQWFASGIYQALVNGDVSAAFSEFLNGGMDEQTAARFTHTLIDIREAVIYFVNGLETNLNTALFTVQYYIGSIAATLENFGITHDFDLILSGLFHGDFHQVEAAVSNLANDLGQLFIDQFNSPIIGNLFLGVSNLLAGNNDTAMYNFTSAWTMFGQDFDTKVTQPIVKGIQEIFANMSPETLQLIGSLVAGIAIAFGAWAAVLIAGGIATALAAIFNPFVLIITLAIVLLEAYMNNWAGFKDFVDSTVAPAIRGIATAFEGVIDTINRAITTYQQLLVVMAYVTGGETAARDAYNNYVKTMNATFGSSLTPVPILPTPHSGNMPHESGGFIPPVVGDVDIGTLPRRGAWWENQHGATGSTTNNINIHSNDPDYILRELRRKGIDLEAPRRG